jgi:hypothetical protein
MLVNDVLNFTIFIKNFIEFPAFGVKHKNMVDELKSCLFHPVTNKHCPIFNVTYIINEAEKDVTERNLMLRYGGVIRVKLDWDCNLDRDIKLCKPRYSFARLDVPFRDKPFSIGFNFRYASYWKRKKTPSRILSKVFGLRFIIAVSGKAGKFDFITLTLNTGSLVGLFGLATFFCDIIILHLSKNSKFYRNYVFETVHLGTRLTSMVQNAEKIFQNRFASSAPKETENPIVSNGTLENDRRSPNNSTSKRPLTFINPDHLTYAGNSSEV